MTSLRRRKPTLDHHGVWQLLQLAHQSADCGFKQPFAPNSLPSFDKIVLHTNDFHKQAQAGHQLIHEVLLDVRGLRVGFLQSLSGFPPMVGVLLGAADLLVGFSDLWADGYPILHLDAVACGQLVGDSHVESQTFDLLQCGFGILLGFLVMVGLELLGCQIAGDMQIKIPMSGEQFGIGKLGPLGNLVDATGAKALFDVLDAQATIGGQGVGGAMLFEVHTAHPRLELQSPDFVTLFLFGG